MIDHQPVEHSDNKLRIMLVNDDGINAPGLVAMEHAVIRAFKNDKENVEILVAAPAREQSAVSHGISLYRDIDIQKLDATHYAIDGTPADCVKIAINHIWPDVRPDLVIAGVNRGQNIGTCVLYSGTVAAAMEAAMSGIPAVAVSLAFLDIFRVSADAAERPAMFDQLALLARKPEEYAFAAQFGTEVARFALETSLPQGLILNVNVPFLPEDEIRGVHVCAMGDAWFSDAFKQGMDETWRNVGAAMIPGSGDKIVDDHALEFERSISISPLHFDMTAYWYMDILKGRFDHKKNSAN